MKTEIRDRDEDGEIRVTINNVDVAGFLYYLPEHELGAVRTDALLRAREFVRREREAEIIREAVERPTAANLKAVRKIFYRHTCEQESVMAKLEYRYDMRVEKKAKPAKKGRKP